MIERLSYLFFAKTSTELSVELHANVLKYSSWLTYRRCVSFNDLHVHTLIKSRVDAFTLTSTFHVTTTLWPIHESSSMHQKFEIATFSDAYVWALIQLGHTYCIYCNLKKTVGIFISLGVIRFRSKLNLLTTNFLVRTFSTVDSVYIV